MVLETKRLLLREMNTDDHQALFLVLGDPETMRYYPHSFDEQHVKDWIKQNMAAIRMTVSGCGLSA